MTTECTKCADIIAFEQKLDEEAQALVERVKDMARDVVERNNERWRTFAWWCNVPLIGRAIFRWYNKPPGLEEIPRPYDEEWYWTEGRLIEQRATELEKLKAEHMEHWGEQTVSPCDSTDPGGYYTPSTSSRERCYSEGLKPFEPTKYDFQSGAGVDKLEVDHLVMCHVSFRLVSKSDCDWSAGESGVFYTARRFSSDPTGVTRPQHNEFVDKDDHRYWDAAHRPGAL